MQNKHVFWFSFILLSVILCVQVYFCFHRNGMLCYLLDDSYIHMAIAKNIARHGVWGVTRFEFSSASSSIFYSLLLAFVFLIFGVNVWIPLIINWVAAAAILYIITQWSAKYFSMKSSLLFSIIFIFLVPLPTIIMTGMEHTLHVLLCLIFICQTFKIFSGEKVSIWAYFLIGLFIAGIRYEGIFLVGITALVWIFIQRRTYIGVLLIIATLIPVLAFGTYASLHGGYFLPNTILIKGVDTTHSIEGFITDITKKFFDSGIIYALLFVPFLYLILFPLSKLSSLRNKPVHLLFIIIGSTCLAHFILARFGRPYRYGAYLIAMELMMIPLIWKQIWDYLHQKSTSVKIVFGILSFIYLIPVLYRLGVTFIDNKCMNNIHDQQVEMAFFIRKYFPKTTVALNDIGAVSFYNNNVHIFDLVGLANTDVIKYHTKDDTSFLEKFTTKDHVQIGLLYPDWIEWLGYRQPSEWELLGKWHLTDNYIAGNPDVGIFAADPAMKDTLIAALKAYSSRLPYSVLQSGLYIDQMRE